MTKAAKSERLDTLVVERGLFATKESARTAIMEGFVLVDGKPVTKPGQSVKTECAVSLSASYQPPRYVSRGGLKLEKALKEFNIDVSGRICLDVGASTGGFTDCLLKHGATCVYSIDVGYGQLDWRLRQDNRVKVFERVNARNLTPDQLYGDAAAKESWADFACMDVSFISAFKVLPGVLHSMNETCAEFVILVKPQFEAGRQSVGHGGVVRDPAVHRQVLERAVETAAQIGLFAQAISYSPIKGPKGNIEFLLHLKSNQAEHINLEAIVAKAHEELAAQTKGDTDE
ncbi:MAG: TlyA family rRNA (cytidine-2'-O)-methyltransferase [Cyanobacteria bacterium PR.3.49]|nr:TlyA family rRNA (cytidine-2'-O)-methyltransferase [Cyanobacteria bacterium PR.3.49]